MPKRPCVIRQYAWSALVLLSACAAPEEVEYTPPVGDGGSAGTGAASGGTSGGAGTSVAGTSTTPGSSGSGGSGGSTGANGGSGGTSGSAGEGGSAATTSMAGSASKGGSAGTSGTGGTSGSASGGSGNAGAGTSGGTGGGAPAGDLPFLDNFEDGNAAGWVSVDDEGAMVAGWSVVMDGTSVFKQGTASSDPSWSIGGNVAWTDQLVEVKLKFDDAPDESAAALIAARFKNFDAYYYLELRGDGGIKIRKRVEGSTGDVTRFDPDAPLSGNTWYTVGLGAVGSTLTAYFNGVPVATGTDSEVTAGGIGIGTTDEAIVSFDDVSVTAP